MKSHKRNARRRNARRIAATTVASGLLAAGALALTTSAASASTLSTQSHGTAYSFRTLDNAKDLTFNQLLGINDSGVIAGYFGSGAQGHPNKGYQLLPPYGQGNYINENFPGSVQTQVTGLNNRGVTVGFWSTMNNANMVNNNFGFVDVNGQLPHRRLPDQAARPTRRSTSCSASTTATSRSASTPTRTATTTATSTTSAPAGTAQ